MKDKELRSIIIKEINAEHLPEEAQDEIILKVGENILSSLTTRIFEQLSSEDRNKFETISKKGDSALINEFLEEVIPDMHSLMEKEIKKTLQQYREKEERERSEE